MLRYKYGDQVYRSFMYPKTCEVRLSYMPLHDSPAMPSTVFVASAPPLFAMPSLDGRVQADVVVVGAGFTGLSAALHAASAGMRVVVLEANDIGWGSSGRNQGQVVPAMRQEPDHIRRTFGDERGERLIEATGAGPDLVFDLIAKYSIDCAPVRKGIITAAHCHRAYARLQHRVDYWQARGKPVELLDRQTAASMIGGGNYYVGASLDLRGGTINPLGFVRGMARAAIEKGVAIYTDTVAARLSRAGTRWIVEAPKGSVTADTVLICTNAYLDNLWPHLRRSIIPIRAYQLVTKPLPDYLRHTILPGGRAMSDTKRVVIGIRLHPDGRLQVGGSNATTGAERAPAVVQVERRVLSLFPQIKGLDWDFAWSGWMAMTPDYYPRLHELAPGLLAGFGYSGRGIAMATILGRDLARRAGGARLDDLVMPATKLRPLRRHLFRRPLIFCGVRFYRWLDSLDRLIDFLPRRAR